MTLHYTVAASEAGSRTPSGGAPLATIDEQRLDPLEDMPPFDPGAAASDPAAPDHLTHEEHEALTKCEEEIDTQLHVGEESYIRVGRALTTIQQSRLYRASYDSFEKYAFARFGMAKATAHRFI